MKEAPNKPFPPLDLLLVYQISGMTTSIGRQFGGKSCECLIVNRFSQLVKSYVTSHGYFVIQATFQPKSRASFNFASKAAIVRERSKITEHYPYNGFTIVNYISPPY